MRDRSKWASVVSHHGLTCLVALSLLALLLFLLGKQPTLAQADTQQARTVAAPAAIDVQQTVGTAPGICAPTPVIAAQSTTVYYCVTIRNTGDSPLTRHTLFSSLLGIPTTFTTTLEPGKPISVTANVLTGLGADGALLAYQILANPVGTIITHTVLVTSTTAQGDLVTGQATARVVVGSVGLKITKTVGLDSNCATTKGIAVDINTPVKYCVAMQNTGTLPLIRHHMIDSLLNLSATRDLNDNSDYILSPGETIRIADIAKNSSAGSPSSDFVVTDNVTNTMIINSFTDEGVSVSDQDQAVALIGRSGIVLTATLGIEDTTCGTSRALAIVSGRTVYHCLRLTNTGTVPLETYEIRSTTVPVFSTILTETLQPGQSVLITHTRIAQLAQVTVTAGTTYNFDVTARNSQGIVATDNAQSQSTVGTQGLTINKYATTDPNGCKTIAPLNIVSSQSFYYCIVVTNTGSVPLVRHTFTEGTPANINGAFSYTLAQNQSITLTNQFLVDTLKLPALLGPFTASASFPGTMAFTSVSDANIQTTVNLSFQVNVVAPTLTPSPSPTPFPTFTPTISPTPSLTPIIPPTPTATPIMLSLPATPGSPLGVDAVTTPTPGLDAGSAPPALDAFGQPILPEVPAVTVDSESTVWALTAEAAATETAWAMSAQPIVETPTPFPPVDALAEPPPESPLATATLLGGVPTATALALGLSPLPTPPFLDNSLDVIARALQVSTTTLGWIWFLVGSIVFFSTAGMFFGLSWLQQRRRQAAGHNAPADTNLVDDSLTPDFNLDQPAKPKPFNDDEDYWPASLR